MSDADYARVAKAIDFIGRKAPEQPRLEAVARHVGLSPFHFSRLFRRWAGLSPKRFLEVVTARRAREALASTHDLLGAALATGLSGPGRLHDLSVTIHAMTPAELRDGGAGLEILAGFHPTPFGECLAAATPRGICRLEFVRDRKRAMDALRREWPNASIRHSPGATRERVRRAFASRIGPEGPLHVRGTNFQVRIWEALLRIPPGTTAAYGDVAAAVKRPRAVRAAGSAVGRNPVAFLIPCHRVILASGAVGGYRWGATRKRALLGWEAARRVGPGTRA